MQIVSELQQWMLEQHETDFSKCVSLFEENYRSEDIAGRLKRIEASEEWDPDEDRDTLEAVAEAPVVVIPCCAISEEQFSRKPSDRNPADEEEIYWRSRPFRKVHEEKAFHLMVWWDQRGNKQETMLDLFTAGAVVACLEAAKRSAPGRLGQLLTLDPLRLVSFCFRLINA